MSGFVRGGGRYAPLVDAGEHICECLRDGDKVHARFFGAVREGIVRCCDCHEFRVDNSDHDYRSGWWCDRWDTDRVEPNGFCAWGKEREED